LNYTVVVPMPISYGSSAYKDCLGVSSASISLAAARVSLAAASSCGWGEEGAEIGAAGAGAGAAIDLTGAGAGADD